MAWYDEFNPIPGKTGGGGLALPMNNPFKWNGGYTSGNDPNTYAFGINGANESGAQKGAQKATEDWRKSGEQRETEQGVADQTLMGQMNQNVGVTKAGMLNSKWKWDEDQKGLEADLDNRARNSRATYSNDIQPRMKSQMEKAQTNSNSAMSLQDAMDPNNKVAKGTRDLYETQAQGEGKQGLADVGILQAMGAQSAASQMGGTPMTGGQMAAIYGQNQAQAGSAYGNTQRRQQSLRDTGLNKGFERSDIAYGQGLDAQDRYRRSVGDYEGADRRHQQDEAGIDKERAGLSDKKYSTDQGFLQDVFGLDSGMSGLQHQLATGKTTRGHALDERTYGGSIKQSNANAAAAAAKQAGREKALGGLVGTAFSGWGGMAGAAGGGEDSGDTSSAYADNSTGLGLTDDDQAGYGLTSQMQPSYQVRPGGSARRRYG